MVDPAIEAQNVTIVTARSEAGQMMLIGRSAWRRPDIGALRETAGPATPAS
jgi:hypothetical protein